ncbi:protein of unknown function [Taphrina deformans PYCC 5710]|uniref:Uncharacterized protein n=1 Tax=Taphrina deformans (strain PYCC 5710 / ATCC 11124 / CBS 356.35 / IMI 108563 / JCM 9778 / NBRC 8474) TaxID=1097556 RepID=R4XFP3_TAPDE|nr:protein of unknown function [Taphrina deformans PYCC 5710]|eukprot:CCG83307.1 protein of unknown function [Taphrina deformans PYCC 5710]
MKFTVIFSALIAAVAAAPAEAACPGTGAPATPPAPQCTWFIDGQSTTMTVGESITFQGVEIACGTTGHANFGVFAKCKLQPKQAGTCDTEKGVEGVNIECHYKTSGKPNYGTCS